MGPSIATPDQHERFVLLAALAGLFFGLMPPYVLTIVVVATWGVPPLEPPTEQTFRAVYFLRLVLGNILGLTVGAGTAAIAADLGLRLAGRATYPRAVIAGAILGCVVGGLSAVSCPLLLFISSSDPNWAWIMVQRSLAVGALMGTTNGMAAGAVMVYLIRRANGKRTFSPTSPIS